MRLNGFSVRIVSGPDREHNGYVTLKHGATYKIVLRNDNPERCDAEVSIDGKSVGAWRIDGRSSVTLERPVSEAKKFTFFRAGTAESVQAGLGDVSDQNLGLIRVVFKPEAKVKPLQDGGPVTWHHADEIYPTISVTYSDHAGGGNMRSGGGILRSMSLTSSAGIGEVSCYNAEAGGTGLTGYSGQTFYSTSYLPEYDTSRITTIHVRLVAEQERVNITPLRTETDVPPPVQRSEHGASCRCPGPHRCHS